MPTTPDHHNHHKHHDRHDHRADGQRLSVADHQQGKTRVLTRQCATCIFHPGDPMHLAPGRLSEMVTQARRAEGYIICHDTLPYGNHPHTPPAVCRGFYDRYTTLSLQLARRLWGIVEIEPPDQTSTPAQWTAGR